nr:hypothetical protein [Tanacetum cinerariifolium]
MITLAEFMIIAGADNRPPMLKKSLYDSRKSCMEHYIENRENRRTILILVQNSSLIWPTVTDKDEMAFLIVVASLRFPSTNKQLRTSANLRNQATIQDGRVTVQQVQGRQGQSYASNSYKGITTSSGGSNTG